MSQQHTATSIKDHKVPENRALLTDFDRNGQNSDQKSTCTDVKKQQQQAVLKDTFVVYLDSLNGTAASKNIPRNQRDTAYYLLNTHPQKVAQNVLIAVVVIEPVPDRVGTYQLKRYDQAPFKKPSDKKWNEVRETSIRIQRLMQIAVKHWFKHRHPTVYSIRISNTDIVWFPGSTRRDQDNNQASVHQDHITMPFYLKCISMKGCEPCQNARPLYEQLCREQQLSIDTHYLEDESNFANHYESGGAPQYFLVSTSDGKILYHWKGYSPNETIDTLLPTVRKHAE